MSTNSNTMMYLEDNLKKFEKLMMDDEVEKFKQLMKKVLVTDPYCLSNQVKIGYHTYSPFLEVLIKDSIKIFFFGLTRSCSLNNGVNCTELNERKMEIVKFVISQDLFSTSVGNDYHDRQFIDFTPMIITFLKFYSSLLLKSKEIDDEKRRKEYTVQAHYFNTILKLLINHQSFDYFYNVENHKKFEIKYDPNDKGWGRGMRGDAEHNFQSYLLEHLINGQHLDLLYFLFKKYNMFKLNESIKPKENKTLKKEEKETPKEHILKIIKIYLSQDYEGTYQDLVDYYLKVKSTLLLILYGDNSKFYVPKELIEIIFSFSPSLNSFSFFICDLLLEKTKYFKEEQRNKIKKTIWKDHLIYKSPFSESKTTYTTVKKKCNIS